MKQAMMGWQWHQLDHMQIICTSFQTDNHASTSSLNFYRPDTLTDTQPTVSKQWTQTTGIKEHHWNHENRREKFNRSQLNGKK